MAMRGASKQQLSINGAFMMSADDTVSIPPCYLGEERVRIAVPPPPKKKKWVRLLGASHFCLACHLGKTMYSIIYKV